MFWHLALLHSSHNDDIHIMEPVNNGYPMDCGKMTVLYAVVRYTQVILSLKLMFGDFLKWPYRLVTAI